VRSPSLHGISHSNSVTIVIKYSIDCHARRSWTCGRHAATLFRL